MKNEAEKCFTEVLGRQGGRIIKHKLIFKERARRYGVLNKRGEILYLQATMHYYLNTLLTRRSRSYSGFRKRTRFHSFMALNRASDVAAADWQSQTHVNYRIDHFHKWRRIMLFLCAYVN